MVIWKSFWNIALQADCCQRSFARNKNIWATKSEYSSLWKSKNLSTESRNTLALPNRWLCRASWAQYLLYSLTRNAWLFIRNFIFVLLVHVTLRDTVFWAVQVKLKMRALSGFEYIQYYETPRIGNNSMFSAAAFLIIADITMLSVIPHTHTWVHTSTTF